MRKFHVLFLIVILNLFAENSFAQKKYAPTFLWKITGNGLTKPSYMYGTMHLQDKELFNLGDSIYYALESVDGFSMEVDPVALIDTLLKTLNDKDDSPLLKEVIEEKKLKEFEKNIESKFGVTADKLTVKKLKKYIQNKAYQKKPGQMKTFMDMYLYNIAKKQNKQFAPVEDLEDQLGVMENYTPKSLEKYLETDSLSEENYLQDFKKIYIDKNLTALAKMIDIDKTEMYNSLGLVKRNIKMARRIDSLTKIRTSFIAIGAAHLPGESGLIKLLQKKGFTIEPVISTKNIKPEEYKYKAIDKEWINSSDEEGLIQVQVPIEPSPIPTGAGIDMKMCIDLTDYSLYGFTAAKSVEANTDIAKISERMLKNYKASGFEILSNKQIIQNGINGLELIGREKNEYIYRIRVLLKENVMAILICGAQNKKYLYDDNFEKFFNSIKFSENVKVKEWVEYVNEENSYSVQVPQKPKKRKDETEAASTIYTYSTVDASSGCSYLLQSIVPKIGYYFSSDSDYYNNYKKSLNENTKNGLQFFSPALLNDLPAMHFLVLTKEDDIDIAMKGYILKRGNNFQILLAVTEKEKADYPNVSSFFNSYKALPFKKTNWTTQEIKEIELSLKTPSTFEKRESDSSSISTGKSYFAQDKNTAATFYVDVDSIPKYVWYKNDSASYRTICENYKEYADSTVSFTYDTLKYTADILIKNYNSNIYKKVRVAVNGSKIYSLFSYLPKEIMEGEAEQNYFKEYKFTTVKKPTIFENNIKLLTDSLLSKDSATAEVAFKALNSNKYSKSDLPFLQNALLKNYTGADKEEGEYRARIIRSKIILLADSSSVNFISDNYKNNDTNDNLKVCMLEILAEVKTEKSYALLKSLLLNSGLKSCNSYNFSYSIIDTLELAKSFFPDVTVLYKDTLLGGAMMQIASRLLDSNLISKTVALQNQEGILQNAAHQIMVIKRDKTGSSPESYETIQMLGRINSKQSNELLQKYFAFGDEWDTEPALIQLLKNNVPVLPEKILKIAANKTYRTQFYDDLVKIGKEKFFPKLYLTQQKFAEAYLYELLTEEYEQENPIITFLSEKISKVGGIEKRYFIFKIKNVYDGETTYNLGIMGGFEKNVQKVSLKYDDQQYYYYYDEKFNAAKINTVYEDFIKQQNENLKKN